MEATLLITSVVTLFVIVDPIGLTPIFFSLTQELSKNEILSFIGISMPAFSIAGGILLFLTALEMLFQKRKQRREAQGNEALASHNDPSVFPLAVL